MTDDEYRKQLDAEQVERARRPFPDLSRVRRVRVDDEYQHQLAVAANADREREGGTE